MITKSIADRGFRDLVQKLLPEARNVIRVHAHPTVLDEGYTIKVMGLKTLVDHSMNVIPTAVRDAFAAAQKVDLDQKRQRAHLAVAAAAGSAALIGGIPVPFSDAVGIVPVQISMLATISVIWGIPLSHAFLATLVGSTLTGTAGTIGGRVLAANLLKLLPGVGTIAGGFITGGIAGTITTTFGEAYIATLYSLTRDNPDRELSPEEIGDAFQRHLKRATLSPQIST